MIQQDLIHQAIVGVFYILLAVILIHNYVSNKNISKRNKYVRMTYYTSTLLAYMLITYGVYKYL